MPIELHGNWKWGSAYDVHTTQSEHYYMIEVLKTFTQGKKVVKVLEKKIFNLQLLEKGEIKYFTNILLTSSQDNNK